MKEKPLFEESRPEMFRLFLRESMAELLPKVTTVGPTGHRHYIGGATRKRVRALARRQARLDMRKYRDGMRRKAAA